MTLGRLKTLKLHLVELYVGTTLFTTESKHDLTFDYPRLSDSSLLINLISTALKKRWFRMSSRCPRFREKNQKLYTSI